MEKADLTAKDREAQKETLPPFYCEPCRKVHILNQENYLAWRVYITVIDQQIRDQGALIGILNSEIMAAIKFENGREDQRTTFKKVKAATVEYTIIDAEMAAKRREKSDREAKKSAKEAKRNKPRRRR